jgi:hypothetical protein
MIIRQIDVPNNTHAVVKTFGIFGEFFLVAPTKTGCYQKKLPTSRPTCSEVF